MVPSTSWKSSETPLDSSTTRNGPNTSGFGSPSTSVRNLAETCLSRHQTMVWLSVAVMMTAFLKAGVEGNGPGQTRLAVRPQPSRAVPGASMVEDAHTAGCLPAGATGMSPRHDRVTSVGIVTDRHTSRPSAPMTGLSHVQLVVSDVSASAAWYTAALGLEPYAVDLDIGYIALRHRAAKAVFVLTVGSGDGGIEDQPGGGREVGPESGGVLDHLAFAVPDGTALQGWADHLAHRGHRPSGGGPREWEPDPAAARSRRDRHRVGGACSRPHLSRPPPGPSGIGQPGGEATWASISLRSK